MAVIYSYKGCTEEQGKSVNDFRKLAADVAAAINRASRIYRLPGMHRGKTIPYQYSFEDTDEGGRYAQYAFPVFVRNLDELLIYVKVYLRGGIHGGSCVMWCAGYVFMDIASARQFETQINTAVQFATKQVKSETNK